MARYDYKSHNKKVIASKINIFKSAWDIQTGKYMNNAVVELNDFVARYQFKWDDDTGNLRDSIGFGVYRSGALVKWSGQLSPPTATQSEVRYGSGREVLLDMMLGRFVPPKRPNVKIWYTIQLVIAMPYGWAIDSNSDKALGWIDSFLADVRKEMDNIGDNYKVWIKSKITD